MNDNSSSEELEEGNIFQLARVTSARKRRRIQSGDGLSANDGHNKNYALPSSNNSDELIKVTNNTNDPPNPLLHTISLSPFKSTQHPSLKFDLSSSPIKSAPIVRSVSPVDSVLENVIENNTHTNRDDDPLIGLSGANNHTHSDDNRKPHNYNHQKPDLGEQNEPIKTGVSHLAAQIEVSAKQLPTDARKPSPISTEGSAESELGSELHSSMIPSEFSISESGGNPEEIGYFLPSLQPTITTAITSVENRSIRDLVATMSFVEIPFTEVIEPDIQIQQPLTKAHTIRSQIIKSTIGKVQKRMARDAISVNSLQETNISLPAGENTPESLIRQLWTTGSQVGRLAQLNIMVRHLKQTRTELMNQISEYRSTAGLNRASAQAYTQFKTQVEEARSTLLQTPASGHTLASIKQKVEDIQAQLTATSSQCTAREEEYRLSSQKQVAKIKAEITSLITTKNAPLASIEHSIRQAGAELGASVSFTGATQMVVALRYLNITVDVATSSPPIYDFSYPKVMLPVSQHFERLVNRSFDIVEACKLWNRCLAVRTALDALLARGPYRFEILDKNTEPTLVFHLHDLESNRHEKLRFNGAQVLIDEPISVLLMPLQKIVGSL